MRRLTPLLALTLLAGCAANMDEAPEAGVAARGPSAEELIAARKAGMHMAATLLFQLAQPAMKNGTDLKPVEYVGNGLARFGDSLPGLFPPGSGGPGSRAKPELWANKADFDAKAREFGAASARLAELAKTGDRAGVTAQFAVVGQGCGGCHKPYRSE